MLKHSLVLAALLFGMPVHADCPPAAPDLDPGQLAQWAAHAGDHGAIWRIERDGHSSWLYGSLHVGKPEWAIPGPKLSNAIQQTDVLAVELDISNPDILARVLKAARFEGKVASRLQARLDAQARADCVPDGALAGQHPIMALSTLSLMAAQREGLFMQFGQDLLLIGMAKGLGRPVASLETPESQMQALLPQDQAELETSLADGLDQLEQGQAVTQLRRLSKDWAEGDLVDLADYASWCDCARNERERAELRRLNDDRNGPIAARIAELHGQGQRVLAVVGTLHMIGSHSLPRELEALGFTVTRVQALPLP